MGSMLLLPISLLLLTAKTVAQDIDKIKVSCEVHDGTIVDVDPVFHRYFPYIVKLPRCVGAVGVYRPDVVKCTAKSSISVSYRLLDAATFAPRVVSLQHHTSCKHACAPSAASCDSKFEVWNGETCKCDCKYKQTQRPLECLRPKIWQKNTCKCVCPTSPLKCSDERKEWSKNECMCTCKKRYFNRCARKNKVMDQERCGCMEPVYKNGTLAARGGQEECKGVANKFVVMIVVIEFLGLLFIFFMIYRCCLKHRPELDQDNSTMKRRMKYEIGVIRGTMRHMTHRKKKGTSQMDTSQVQQNENVQSIHKKTELPVALELAAENYAVDTGMQENLKTDIALDNNEEPVGFYLEPHDAFGSEANVSMESSGLVTAV